MYIPKRFEVKDKETMTEFIRENSFGILFSQNGKGPVATHLPFLIKEDTLIGHMAKMNEQWKEIENEVLVVFSGPHAYISPSWYEETDVVPTWNYTAVHVYGEFTPVFEGEELEEILADTVHFYESSMPEPWKMDTQNDYYNRSLKAIVGFKIKITKMEGKWKLNQNHSRARQERVIRQLEKRKDPNARAIADLMRGNLERN
ncbi:MAG TPA: FMN-binding negative transcriptional regulator [Bacillales bacterium]|nr:FMN-binding negative transcriptional regulator [Bacillales bacterium]